MTTARCPLQGFLFCPRFSSRITTHRCSKPFFDRLRTQPILLPRLFQIPFIVSTPTLTQPNYPLQISFSRFINNSTATCDCTLFLASLLHRHNLLKKQIERCYSEDATSRVPMRPAPHSLGKRLLQTRLSSCLDGIRSLFPQFFLLLTISLFSLHTDFLMRSQAFYAKTHETEPRRQQNIGARSPNIPKHPTSVLFDFSDKIPRTVHITQPATCSTEGSYITKTAKRSRNLHFPLHILDVKFAMCMGESQGRRTNALEARDNTNFTFGEQASLE
ncbi:uncharacterized protein BDR25DRAFT_347874 [Lindgomyces ingoldianus]|uniref:Uncharacterized protein n=1 Tax=Lindgomyces ingoldianus TaxID=673940 RepID=A0ACB6RG99_9PLEO|nr:uncharacterized protein BDR25DRAFT_347874 [Lindgomyces ingoldianus]KAF2477522.1 hypothetical protein BDR25DRAFT_347874 [Lindgomyces ingoldianus]